MSSLLSGGEVTKIYQGITSKKKDTQAAAMNVISTYCKLRANPVSLLIRHPISLY